VAARHGDWRGYDVAEVRLRQSVRDLLTAPTGDERKRAHGELPPTAIRRAEQLINEAMENPHSAVADPPRACGDRRHQPEPPHPFASPDPWHDATSISDDAALPASHGIPSSAPPDGRRGCLARRILVPRLFHRVVQAAARRHPGRLSTGRCFQRVISRYH